MLTLSSSGGGSFPSSLSLSVGNTALAPDRVEGVHRQRRRSARSGTCTRTRTGTRRGPVTARTRTRRARTATVSRSGPARPASPGAAGRSRRHGLRRPSICRPSSCATAIISASSGTHDIVAVHDADNGCPTGLQYTVGTFNGPGSSLDRVAVRHVDVQRDRASPYGGTLADGHVRPARQRGLRRERGLAVMARRRADASQVASTRPSGSAARRCSRSIAVVTHPRHRADDRLPGHQLRRPRRSAAPRSGSPTSTRPAILMAVSTKDVRTATRLTGGHVAVHAGRQARGHLLRQPQQRRVERLGGRQRAAPGADLRGPERAS